MIWSLYVPAASLLIFFVWMLRITLRAFGQLRQVGREVDQLTNTLNDLKMRTHVGEVGERWLSDTFSYVSRTSFSGTNPLTEIVSRFYAMKDLASPDLAAALESVSEREVDKLEAARETPGSLLLLGIMGTVVGMVLALSTFGAAGLLETGEVIDISRIITSMFLAFISTGIALLFSVIVRGQLERVAARQAAMLSELEGYAFTHLAPTLLPKNDLVLQAQFHDLMNHQQALLGESLERSSVTLQAFSTAIEEAQRLTYSLSDSMSQNAAAVRSAGERITTDLDAVSSEMSGKLLGALTLIGDELGKQRSDLEALYQQTRQTVEQERRSTLEQADAFRQSANETVELLEANNRELVSTLNSVMTLLTKQASEQTATVQALRQDLGQLSDRLVTAQETYQESFVETVQKLLQDQFYKLSRTLLRRRT